MADKIIVLDFGSQYNQLIARRIREFGVYSELHANTMTLEEIKALGDVKGIIFSGGPNSVYDEDAFKCDPAIFESGLPILGICYGMQMTHYMNGGSVKACEAKEYGRTEITIDTDSLLFKGLPRKQIVWMSHGDQVDALVILVRLRLRAMWKKIYIRYSFIQRFVILIMEMTFCVTLCLKFVMLKIIGPCITLLKWRLKKFGQQLETTRFCLD